MLNFLEYTISLYLLWGRRKSVTSSVSGHCYGYSYQKKHKFLKKKTTFTIKTVFSPRVILESRYPTKSPPTVAAAHSAAHPHPYASRSWWLRAEHARTSWEPECEPTGPNLVQAV